MFAHARHTFLIPALVSLLIWGKAANAAVYQWSVPVMDNDLKTAFMWLPPKCEHVRALVIAFQNMLEQPFLEDPAIRQTLSDLDMGIIWITPGHTGKDDISANMLWKPDGKAQGMRIEKIVDDLARVSGYTEISFAPLMPLGHSAATPFNWELGNQLHDRVFAVIAFKGWYPKRTPHSIPMLHVSSEWAEWDADWGNTWQRKDRVHLERIRKETGQRAMIGEFVDMGTGHFTWNPECAPVISMFIRKALLARTTDRYGDGPVRLQPVGFNSGVLVKLDTLGFDTFKAYPAAEYPDDPNQAYWYLDDEMAKAINDYMAQRLKKKPQMIGFFTDKGELDTYEKAGVTQFGVKWLPDGETFEVKAQFLDKSPTKNLYDGAPLGHVDEPVLYRVGSGALKQVGPNQFKVAVCRGWIVRQSAPWDPWILAYHPGNSEYRSADRPLHAWVYTINKAGTDQTLDFPMLPDVMVGDLKSIELKAEASSSKTVQFYPICGPIEVDGNTLKFNEIPVRANFPIQVKVAAYQWGSAADPKIKTALPVIREFYIKK
jgi:hypothetical protein